MNQYQIDDIVTYSGRTHKVTRVSGITTSRGQMWKYDLVDLDNGIHHQDVSEVEVA